MSAHEYDDACVCLECRRICAWTTWRLFRDAEIEAFALSDQRHAEEPAEGES